MILQYGKRQDFPILAKPLESQMAYKSSFGVGSLYVFLKRNIPSKFIE
jgi:hypothetical protein